MCTVLRYAVFFFVLLCIQTTVNANEIHPVLFYSPDDSTNVMAYLVNEPYLSWQSRLLDIADSIVQEEPAWGDSALSQWKQAYYAKMLSAAWAFTDDSYNNRQRCGDEAVSALLAIPEGDYAEVFSSDLYISESALYWAESYDLLKGTGYVFINPKQEDDIRSRLAILRDYIGALWTGPEGPSIGRDFTSATFFSPEYSDNHHVKRFGALAGVAMAILDEPGSVDALDRAKEKLLAIMNVMTITGDNGEPVGGWAEGPNYHLYSAHEYLPVLTGMERLGRFTFDDYPELVATHLGLPELVMPDGYTVPFDDNEAIVWKMAGLLYSLHKNEPDSDALLWMWSLTGQAVDNTFLPDYLAQFDDTGALHANPGDLGWPLSAVYPERGFARFRSSWNSDAVYLFLLSEHGEARINGRAHEHPDPNSLLLHAYGELLLLDSGYGGWDFHDSTRFAENHNLVLIDGIGPSEAAKNFYGIWQAGGADAYITESFTSSWLDYALSETEYENASFNRAVLFVDKHCAIVFDRLASDHEREYTLLWHGNGGGTSGGTFQLLEQGGLWEIGNAALVRQ